MDHINFSGDLRSRLIKLPRNLISRSINDALLSHLSIIREHSGALHFGHQFRPPLELERVVIDYTNVSAASASGLCDLLSLLDWTIDRAARVNGRRVLFDTTGTESLKRFNIGSDLRQIEDPLSIEVAGFPLPPLRISLPPYSSPATPAGSRARDFILGQSDLAAAAINRSLAKSETTDALRSAIAATIYEGILNAYEHAFIIGEPRAERSVWIAASLRAIGSPPRDQQTPIAGWHLQRRELGAEKILEIAVVDNGSGVTATLGEKYLAISRLPSPHRLKETMFLHDEILKYAFSPYGSRKDASDFARPALKHLWRGLHKVLFRAEPIDGLAFLRSGAGLYGRAFGANQTIVLSGLGNLRKHDLYSMPGTMLCLRVALPISQATPSPPNYRWTHVIEANERMASIYVDPALRRELSPTNQNEKNIVDYFDSIGADIYGRAHTVDIEQNSQRLLAIVHPAVHFADIKGDVTQVLRDERIWSPILEMMAANALPGCVPIHCFIDIADRDIGSVQQQFASLARQRAADLGEELEPAICGLHQPSTNRIHWFVCGVGQSDDASASLSQTGVVKLDSNEVIAPWERLRTLYPSCVEIKKQNNDHVVQLRLPTQLSHTIAEGMLSGLVESLASCRGIPSPWYWSSPSGREFVRTPSGRLVTSFVSAFSLCEQEPGIEASLAGCLIRLFRLKYPGQNILLVPDSTSTSFLLAKRLCVHMAGTWNGSVEVVHPEDIHSKTLLANTRIVLFTDAVHTGDRLSKRQEELQSPETAPTVLFACLDLRPKELKKLKPLKQFYTSIRWPLPASISDDELPPSSSILQLDPETNAISESSDDRGNPYLDLVWARPGTPGAGKKDDSDVVMAAIRRLSPFSYGIQLVDGLMHVARCSVGVLVQDPAFMELLVTRLIGVINNLLPASKTDVVLFIRDESVLSARHDDLSLRIAKGLRRRSDERFGRMFMAAIPSTRRGIRQRLVLRPATGISNAKLVPEDAGNRELFERPVDTGFIAVFLDNATISAQAIRDFILAMLQAPPGTHPGKIALCPVVSRLDPSEENLLLKTSSLALDNSDSEFVSIHFDALLQLRIRAYRNLEELPLTQRLREFLGRIEDLYYPEAVSTWSAGVRQKMRSMATPPNPVEQFPLHSRRDLPHVQVSENALLFRHLIGLHQLGIPVTEALVQCLRRTISDRDRSLLIVLAIEPDLLVDGFLSRAFESDIAELALGVLESPQLNHEGVRSNALWVLFQTPSFVKRQRTIAGHCCRDEELRGQWLAQVFAHGQRGEVAGEAYKKLTQQEQPEGISTWQDTIASLSLWQDENPSKVFRSIADARSRVYQFLSEAHVRHGAVGYAAWWTLDNKIREVAQAPTIRKELKKPALWEEPTKFLRGHLIPVMDALFRASDHRILEGMRGLNRAKHDALKYLREARNAAENEDVESLSSAWEQVCRNTMTVPIPQLFGMSPDFVLGSTQGGLSEGYLDLVIPEVVQEPLGLVLHTLNRTLDNAQTITAALTGPRTFPAPVICDPQSGGTRSLQIGKWLVGTWQTSAELPLVWVKVDRLRALAGLVAENVLRHGDSAYPCIVTAEFGPGQSGADSWLKIKIDNQIRLPVRPNQSAGKRQIERLVQELEGTVTFASGKQRFSASLEFPVKVISLVRRGL